MAEAADLGVEGIVVKDLADPYWPGRTRWRKFKTRTTTEAIIGGVTRPVTVPTSLLLGRYDASGRFRYAGFMTRLTSAQSVELGALLQVTEWNTDTGAAHPWPQPLPAGWLGRFGMGSPLAYTQVEPVIVVEILADTAAEHDRHRHAVRLVRLRPDLAATDITTDSLHP
jgi:ATP-dependent DNA ligase